MSANTGGPLAANASAMATIPLDQPNTPEDNEKKSSETPADELRAHDANHDDEGEVQEGVRRMRAITQTWTKRSLTCAYIL